MARSYILREKRALAYSSWRLSDGCSGVDGLSSIAPTESSAGGGVLSAGKARGAGGSASGWARRTSCAFKPRLVQKVAAKKMPALRQKKIILRMRTRRPSLRL